MTRRSLLYAALSPALLGAAATAPRDQVAKLETFQLKVNQRGDWLLLRLTTKSGVTGIGDASQGGNDATVNQLLRDYLQILQGLSIWDLESFRQQTLPEVEKRGRAGAVAYSAIEQCLWDIRGKIIGRPVYDLLGGRLHQRIRTYANINRSTQPRTPEGFAAMAKRAIADGFTAIKLAPFDEMPRRPRDEAEIAKYIDFGLSCAAAVRTAIGPTNDLLIDVHSHVDLRHGLELSKRFDALKLFWLEETTPSAKDLAEIRKAATMPTAGGESLLGVKGFYPYIHAGAVDIVMPDIKYTGGLLETKKIAGMAEGAGLKVSPHGPASPVGNMAAAHVCATLPNFLILEFSYGEVPWRTELTSPAEKVVDGAIIPSDRPGFGITLNEAALTRYKV
jgi:galactonate dehydratase